MTRQEFGDRVYTYRVYKNMVQKELADKIGLTRASVSNIENAIQVVTLDTINKIAEALGMPTKELLYSETLPVVGHRYSRRRGLCDKCAGPMPPAADTAKPSPEKLK